MSLRQSFISLTLSDCGSSVSSSTWTRLVNRSKSVTTLSVDVLGAIVLLQSVFTYAREDNMILVLGKLIFCTLGTICGVGIVLYKVLWWLQVDE